MKAIVRQTTLNDVEQIVRIHQAAFKDFFLTSLGHRFLKLYYSTFIKSGEGVVYCAEVDKKVVGFSACSYVSSGFNSRLIKKNLVRYGLEALRLLFAKPGAIVRLVRNLDKESNVNGVKDNGEYAELYSIAVSPTCQGGGVGRLLLTATEADVKEHNSQISLTTDYYDNEKTVGFYNALGYDVLYEFVTYPDRRMYRMIKNLK